MTSDAQDEAEQVDGNVLGEKPGDDTRPGVGDYPPTEPLGAEDPSIRHDGSVAQDDMDTREWRENPEAGEVRRDAADGTVLIDPEGGGNAVDREAEMLASESPAAPESEEEAAVHER